MLDFRSQIEKIDMKLAEKYRILQLNEFDEFMLEEYKNAKSYKVKTKRWHGRHIKEKEIEVVQ